MALFPSSYSPCVFEFQLTVFLCRKLFVGGLNWDTTDGKFCIIGRRRRIVAE